MHLEPLHILLETGVSVLHQEEAALGQGGLPYIAKSSGTVSV